MKKWSLIALGIVGALIAGVVITGALLPRDHVAAMSARIAAPPAAVWTMIVDPTTYPSWRSDVERVEIVTASSATPEGSSWREISKNQTLTMAIDSATVSRHLVTRIVDTGEPFGGTWSINLEPEGDAATIVTITERGFVSNPIFRFVSRFMLGHTATIDGYLRALGKRFGPEPTPKLIQ